jgi:hypothetical protein
MSAICKFPRPTASLSSLAQDNYCGIEVTTPNTDGIIYKLVMVFAICFCSYERFVIGDIPGRLHCF